MKLIMLPSRIDKATLWKEHGAKFTCEHSESELRVRSVRGGAKQYVKQCLRCGDAVSNPIKAEAALELNGGNPLPQFDDQLQAAWSKVVNESAARIKCADDSAFWSAYDDYLASAEWQEKRRKVFARAHGICEGCGESDASEVHHISYAHVGAEFLFELVAVCKACHDRIHPE